MSRFASGQDIQQLEQIKKRFINWRRTRKAKNPIPKRLWNSAAKIAMQCGLSRTAKALRLNYYDLKKRIDVRINAQSPLAPAFIELSPAAASPSIASRACKGAWEFLCRLPLNGELFWRSSKSFSLSAKK